MAIKVDDINRVNSFSNFMKLQLKKRFMCVNSEETLDRLCSDELYSL